MPEQPSLADLVPNLARASRRELHGPCPFCGGFDRFIVFQNGRGWCRQCGWKGDAIQLVRDRDGLSFTEAKRSLGLDCSLPALKQRRRVTAHTAALAEAKEAYRAWQRQRLIELTDSYRSLTGRLEVATIAYRATQRRPDLYTEQEHSFWAQELATIYHALPSLEHNLDLLTYNIHEAGRFAWWQEEETRV